jgi:hypothetical protein
LSLPSGGYSPVDHSIAPEVTLVDQSLAALASVSPNPTFVTATEAFAGTTKLRIWRSKSRFITAYS